MEFRPMWWYAQVLRARWALGKAAKEVMAFASAASSHNLFLLTTTSHKAVLLTPRIWWTVAVMVALPRISAAPLPDLALISCQRPAPADAVVNSGYSAGSYSAAWLHVVASRLELSGETLMGPCRTGKATSLDTAASWRGHGASGTA